MHTILQSSSNNTVAFQQIGGDTFKRVFNAVLLISAGAFVTMSLFVLMAQLIKQDTVTSTTLPTVFIDPIIFQPEDEKTITKEKLKPIEQVIKTPPVKVEKIEVEPNNSQTNYTFNTHVPKTKLNIDININSAQGNMQATPQFRVDPTYPPEASRDGIEGWVKLGFTVTASGAVSDITVLDAQPARVFDRAARRALKKWKYKPQLLDGKPVSQTGMVVVLDFKLEQSS